MSLYAQEKLEEAFEAFVQWDKAARSDPGGDSPNLAELQEILLDLDAAMHGLSEGPLGRALILKAHALYYEYLYGSLRTKQLQFFDVRTPEKYRPKAEAWELAQRGRDLLRQYEPESRAIADAVVNILQPYFEPDG